MIHLSMVPLLKNPGSPAERGCENPQRRALFPLIGGSRKMCNILVSGKDCFRAGRNHSVLFFNRST